MLRVPQHAPTTDLTPIVIPGKRGQKRKRRLLLAPVYVTDHGSRSRRPVGHTKPLPFMHSSSKSRETLSAIELLPTELLQMIFSYCYSIDFARSSPYVSRELSTTHVYLDCALRSLCVHEPGDADHGQATQVLATRWMTFAMLQQVCDALHAKSLDRGESAVDGPAPDLDHPEVSCHVYEKLLLSPATQLPIKLLAGPWDDEKSRFLYFLCSRGVGIDWETSTHGEVATDGLTQALTERNRKVVACLVSPHASVPPSQAMLRAAVVQYGCDRTIVFHLLESALRIIKEQRGASSNSPIVPESVIDFHDTVLWRWATAKKNENSDGAWLTSALRTAATISSTRSKYVGGRAGTLAIACGRKEHGVETFEALYNHCS